MIKSISIVAMLAIFMAYSTIITAQRKSSRGEHLKTVIKKPSTNNMLSLLQGRWASLEDKKTFFQIEGNKQIDIYGKDILDTATIHFFDECPKKIASNDGERTSGTYLVVQTKPDNFYCYSIEKITSQQLVLLYLPRGNRLQYKKVPSIKLEAINQENTED